MPGGRWEAVDDLLWGPHPRRAGEDGSDRGHWFRIGLVPFGQPCSGLCAARLDHGNALTVDRRHPDRAGGSGHRALWIESVQVQSRIRKDLFQTALGDGNAGQLGNGGNRFQKRVLYGGLDQAPLELVGERPSGQGQRLIERKDARRVGAAVAHTDEFPGPKDGGKGSGAPTAVRVENRAVCLFQPQSRPHITVAAMRQMGWEEKALYLAALGLLLGLDLVERELEGAGGCQPGLPQRERN